MFNSIVSFWSENIHLNILECVICFILYIAVKSGKREHIFKNEYNLNKKYDIIFYLSLYVHKISSNEGECHF